MRMLTPIRWYLAVVAIAFPVLAAAHLLRDRPLDYALRVGRSRPPAAVSSFCDRAPYRTPALSCCT